MQQTSLRLGEELFSKGFPYVLPSTVNKHGGAQRVKEEEFDFQAHSGVFLSLLPMPSPILC